MSTLQSLGIDSDSAPALEEYLGQNNKHEPFHGLSRDNLDNIPSFGRVRIMKDYPLIDPSLEAFSAPQMRPQLSSSASDYLTGGEDGYLDSPQSVSFPMNRHSRSYSHGSFNSSLFSSSQADSASPTDHQVFGQQPGSYSMSRQASGASFVPGLSMLRVRSSTGSSNADGMGSVYNGDMDNLLSGVGGFAGGDGDVSSLHKAPAQIVTKRSSSVSVEDQHDLMVKGGKNPSHQPLLGAQSNPRKQRRIKEGEADNQPAKKNIDAAKQQQMPGKISKSENPAKAADNGTRQSEKKSPGGSRHLPTIKPGKNPNNAPVSTSKSSYIRPPHPRVYCDKCNAHPDGFRGDHELRRHTDREHAPTKKMYIIKDISKGKTLLAKCKACQSGKRYGVDYNAAAHLRRQHFKPKVRNGKNKQKVSSAIDQTVPEMAELRKWMEEIEVRVEVGRNGDLYTKRGSKENEDGTYPRHEGEDGDDTSEEDEEEETQQMDEGEDGRGAAAYQEIVGQKIQQQPSALDIPLKMELGLDTGNPSQSGGAWTLDSYSGSTVNSATYTLSNSQMPQQLTHNFDYHISAAMGSIPLIEGAFNHQQSLGIHLPTQQAHQMLMAQAQDNFLLPPPPYTPENNGVLLSDFAAGRAIMFDETFDFPEIFAEMQGDLKPY